MYFDNNLGGPVVDYVGAKTLIRFPVRESENKLYKNGSCLRVRVESRCSDTHTGIENSLICDEVFGWYIIIVISFTTISNKYVTHTDSMNTINIYICRILFYVTDIETFIHCKFYLTNMYFVLSFVRTKTPIVVTSFGF